MLWAREVRPTYQRHKWNQRGQSTRFEEHPSRAREWDGRQHNISRRGRARSDPQGARRWHTSKGEQDVTSLPGKLADCQERDPAKAELHKRSASRASGSAKMGRNRAFQAVLPLRGKILERRARLFDKMLSSERSAPYHRARHRRSSSDDSTPTSCATDEIIMHGWMPMLTRRHIRHLLLDLLLPPDAGLIDGATSTSPSRRFTKSAAVSRSNISTTR